MRPRRHALHVHCSSGMARPRSGRRRAGSLSLIRVERDDLHAQLMAEDAGVAEKRLPPAEGVQVCAANADPMHAHKRLARSRFRRRRGLRQMQSCRVSPV